MNYLAGETAASSADYRRRARRIRASFSGNSFLTQRAIGNLARNRNLEIQESAAGAGDKRPGASAPLKTGVRLRQISELELRITAVVERGFAEHALSKLQPFGFTFSDRVALLDAAEKLGITRFRANLILAMHENQAPARRSTNSPAATVPKSFGPSLLLILGIEIVVVAALVWMLIG